MSTKWTLPSTITQYAEDDSHIAWNNDTVFPISTVKPLLHIARAPRNDIKMRTYFFQATGFNFQNVPETISGISLKLTMNRSGRITDDTIQLSHNGTLIGENYSNLELHPIKVYGDETSIWGVDNVSSLIQDPSFGITLRFQSHPSWPHNSTPIILSVEMQIH